MPAEIKKDSLHGSTVAEDSDSLQFNSILLQWKNEVSMVRSKLKLIFFIFIGLAAFIFFGFFFPILILPKPLDLANIILRPAPTVVVTPKPVAVMGSDVVGRSIDSLTTETFPADLRITRCFKEKLGVKGNCSHSTTTEILPAYLIPLYERLGKIDKKEQVAATLLSACERRNSVCKASLLTFFKEYRRTGDSRYLLAMKRVATELISSVPASYYAFLLDTQKLVHLYELTADQSYLEEAVKRLDSAPGIARADTVNPVIYKHDETGDEVRRFDCGLYGGVFLSLYQATGNGNYLSASKRFFATLAPSVERYGHLGAYDLCLDGLRALAVDFQAAEFIPQLKDVLNYGIEAYWDSLATPKFSGDQGFLLSDYFAQPSNQILNFKYPLEQTWFLSHVVEFPDTLFQLRGSNL